MDIIHFHSSKHRVIHKSVKHFKNSQQTDCATDHGNSYADRERKFQSFCSHSFIDAQYVQLW
jgi:hypothetical protein